jgi:hypothetical protein
MNNLPISRDEAWAVRSKTYWTGIPCINGHISYRYTQNGSCAECINPPQENRAKMEYWQDRVRVQQERRAARERVKARVSQRSNLCLLKLNRMPDDLIAQFTAVCWTWAVMKHPLIELNDCKGRAKLSWMVLPEYHGMLTRTALEWVKNYYAAPEQIVAIAADRDRRHGEIVADIEESARIANLRK